MLLQGSEEEPVVQITVEVKEVAVLGVPSGVGHLYLVLKRESGEELVISGGPAGNFPSFGDLVVDSNDPIDDERDENGNPSDTVKGIRVLDFGDRDLEDVWSLLVQHAEQIDAEGLSYLLFDQNSNSTIASILHLAGLDVEAVLPENNLSVPGTDNYLNFDYTLQGSDSGDIIQGVNGDDRFIGATGDDHLIGNLGDDRLFGGLGTDSLSGGSGDDNLIGGSGTDFLESDSGDDRLDARSGADWLYGGDGNDILRGQAGADYAFGGLGDDTMIVETFSDQVFEAAGEGGRDLVRSNASAFQLPLVQPNNEFERASLNASAGAATLLGNEHQNTLVGNDFDNRLEGGSGADSLNGRDGNDILDGASGADKLRGHSGDDLLWLNEKDTAFGGSGADSFAIIDPAAAGPALKNFSGLQFNAGSGEGDKILFAHAPLSGTLVYRGEEGFLADSNSQVRFLTTNKLRIDSDGDGAGDFSLRISNLTSAEQLTAADFLWV